MPTGLNAVNSSLLAIIHLICGHLRHLRPNVFVRNPPVVAKARRGGLAADDADDADKTKDAGEGEQNCCPHSIGKLFKFSPMGVAG